MTVLELDQESFTYPRALLADCASGLLLFCSGRGGAADGHWIREAGLIDVTCVDWDDKTLGPFQDAYPKEWRYLLGDAFEYAENADRRWDIVSADPPSQYRDIMVASLDSWCAAAEKYVIATVMTEQVDEVPAGWSLGDLIPRASYPDGREYFWSVLERA